MSNENRDTITSTTQETANLRHRIGFVSGIPADQVDPEELQIVYKPGSTDMKEVSRLVDKYLSRGTTHREKEENLQTWLQLTEALLDTPPKAASYGLFAPSYREGLLLHKELAKSSNQPHRALLVGALTPDTIHEFTTTVRSIFPDAECVVADREGVSTVHATKNVAHFVYGDARALPFEKKSFDSVHTNALGLQLAPRMGSVPSGMEIFYRQTERILKDDGTLIMVEWDTAADAESLKFAGLKLLQDKPAIQYSLRRDMERVLTFGAPDDIATHETSTGKNIYIARKPRF